jgi:hypothetical protein
MEIPIIIDNFGDILVFSDVQKAENYLEATDVDNNEYVGYDSRGRLLSLTTRGNSVIIQLAEIDPKHDRQLFTVLSGFLARVLKRKGLAWEWLSQASLEELVTKALEYKTG